MASSPARNAPQMAEDLDVGRRTQPGDQGVGRQDPHGHTPDQGHGDLEHRLRPDGGGQDAADRQQGHLPSSAIEPQARRSRRRVRAQPTWPRSDGPDATAHRGLDGTGPRDGERQARLEEPSGELGLVAAVDGLVAERSARGPWNRGTDSARAPGQAVVAASARQRAEQLVGLVEGEPGSQSGLPCAAGSGPLEACITVASVSRSTSAKGGGGMQLGAFEEQHVGVRAPEVVHRGSREVSVDARDGPPRSRRSSQVARMQPRQLAGAVTEPHAGSRAGLEHLDVVQGAATGEE